MIDTYVFIINPISGVVKKENIEKQIAEKALLFQKKYHIAYSEYAKHLPLLVEQLIQEGYKKIVVVGGDGTINEAVEPLLNQPVSLGIVPMGSGNGLARHLNLPLKPTEAIEKIFSSNKIEVIDVGKINDSYYVSNAGIGYDAVVTNWYEKTPNRGLLTYVKCALKGFFTSKSFSYQLNNQETTRKSILINFANASQYGYGFKIASKAVLNDGLFNTTIVKSGNKLALLLFGLEMILNYTKDTPITNRFQTDKAFLQSKTKIPLQVDGEYVGEFDTFNVTIHPKSLSIMV